MNIRRAGIAAVAAVAAIGCALPALARDPVLEIPGAQVIKARRGALPDDAIFHLAVAPSGEVWVATGRGVTSVDAAGRMRPVEALARGRPWVATNVGLFARIDGTWQEIPLPYGGVVKQSAVGCVAAHPDGFLLAEILNYGLVRIDARTLAYERVTAGDCPLRVDRAGNAWFARNDGLYRLRRGDIGASAQPERLTGVRVVDIAFDVHDRTWVSTRLGGIVMYDGSGWTTLAQEQQRHAENWINPLPLAFDRDGNLWTGGAVVHYFSKAEGTGLVRVPQGALPAAR